MLSVLNLPHPPRPAWASSRECLIAPARRANRRWPLAWWDVARNQLSRGASSPLVPGRHLRRHHGHKSRAMHARDRMRGDRVGVMGQRVVRRWDRPRRGPGRPVERMAAGRRPPAPLALSQPPQLTVGLWVHPLQRRPGDGYADSRMQLSWPRSPASACARRWRRRGAVACAAACSPDRVI